MGFFSDHFAPDGDPILISLDSFPYGDSNVFKGNWGGRALSTDDVCINIGFSLRPIQGGDQAGSSSPEPAFDFNGVLAAFGVPVAFFGRGVAIASSPLHAEGTAYILNGKGGYYTLALYLESIPGGGILCKLEAADSAVKAEMRALHPGIDILLDPFC